MPWDSYKDETRRRIKLGFCRRCLVKKARPGKSYCAPCLPAMRRHSQRMSDKLKRAGLCKECCRNPRWSGHQFCRSCYYRERRAWRARHLKRYIRLRKLGICTLCGKRKSRGKHYCPKCGKRQMDNQREKVRALRLEALRVYGGNPPSCKCCGEKETRFLSIDHVNNDGCRHRKRYGGLTGLWSWLRARDYPKGFQVLCMNCNWGRAYTEGKVCPHKLKKATP